MMSVLCATATKDTMRTQTWARFLALLVTLLLHVSRSQTQSYGSSLTSSQCPPGWSWRQQFCLTRGQGSSEKAVALFCDSLGAIGVHGYCLLKASIDRSAVGRWLDDSGVNLSETDSSSADNEPVPSSDTVEDDGRLSLYRDVLAPHKLQPTSQDIVEDAGGTIAGKACPDGWTYYRDLCVYRPRAFTQICQLMDSVEFHGYCIKRADVETETRAQTLDDMYRTEKRICCCASFRAKGNNYGC